MENSTLPGDDIWEEVTTSLSAYVKPNILSARDLVFKVICIIAGTVGILDNLLVIVVFIFFTKIGDKVYRQTFCMEIPFSHIMLVQKYEYG